MQEGDEAAVTVAGSSSGQPSVTAARAAARLSKSLELALATVRLSLPQYRLLAFLAGGPERATALAGWLDVSPPSLTALVDGAVARGLVERVAVEADRRCVRHVITTLGQDALAAADETTAAKIKEVTDHLCPAEAEKVHDALELLARALDAAREASRGEAPPPGRG